MYKDRFIARASGCYHNMDNKGVKCYGSPVSLRVIAEAVHCGAYPPAASLLPTAAPQGETQAPVCSCPLAPQ